MTTSVALASKDFAVALKDNMKSIQSVLPAHMDLARFCRMSLNCLLKNPELAKCTKESFVMSVLNLGEMGLEPSLGQAALIPYKGICTVQCMFQGLIELCRRSGQISTITAEVVKEGDAFEYRMGLNPTLDHTPASDRSGATKYVYAVAELKDGGKQFVVLTASDIEKIAKSSPSFGGASSPWTKWREEMEKKTAIKRLCKMLPKSTELAKAIALDDQADAGKSQLPAFADMFESTLDLNKIAASAQDPEPIITKPRAKGEPKPLAEYIAELMAIEAKVDGDMFDKVRGMAMCDNAEAVEMMDIKKVKELISLYKVEMA